MNILPIRSLSDSDKRIYGLEWVNLGLLARSGFPVPEGLVIEASEDFLSDFKRENLEEFEQNFKNLRAELKKTAIPSSLSKELKRVKNYFWQGNIYQDEVKLWQNIALFWLDEARSKVWKRHSKIKLTTQAIFFIAEKGILVTAYLDQEVKQVVVKNDVHLAPTILQQIDDLVMKASKKLIMPYVFHFLVDEKLELIALSPFAQNFPFEKSSIAKSNLDQVLEIKAIRSTIKVFYESQGKVVEGIDGIVFEDRNDKNFDEKVLALAKLASEFNGPIIYQLPNISDGDLKGTLRLVQQTSLLSEAADAFLFARNKKNLLNLELAIPFVRGVDEYLQIKRDLAVRGITRKGALKFWLEFATPENLINLGEYIIAGLDGVILNLASLNKLLLGFEETEKVFYQHKSKALADLLSPALKKMQTARISVLVKINNGGDQDLLESLIEMGIKGVIVGDENQAKSLPEQLNHLDKRIISRRFLN